MNDHQLDKKVSRDAVKVRKDFSTLVGDSVTRLGRLEGNVSQATGKAKEELTTYMEDGVSQLSEGVEKLISDTRHNVVEAAESVKKDVGEGLSQYNARVQEVADKVPGGFAKKASRYPWVAMSIALAVGFVLRSMLIPARRTYGKFPM